MSPRHSQDHFDLCSHDLKDTQFVIAMPKPVVPAKHRLTLRQLSAYDDILTDALVDHVRFCSTYPVPDLIVLIRIGLFLDNHSEE